MAHLWTGVALRLAGPGSLAPVLIVLQGILQRCALPRLRGFVLVHQKGEMRGGQPAAMQAMQVATSSTQRTEHGHPCWRAEGKREGTQPSVGGPKNQPLGNIWLAQAPESFRSRATCCLSDGSKDALRRMQPDRRASALARRTFAPNIPRHSETASR